MIFDIAVINSNCYRGIDRNLTIPYNKKTRKDFDKLLDRYFEYIEELQKESSKSKLESFIIYCKELEQYEIKCEIIVCDANPIESLFGYELEFLGFDICHDEFDFLLTDGVPHEAKQFLNENGLCRSKSDVEQLIPILDHGNAEWNPCYVYKVVTTDKERDTK